jgi:hypothetical protein
MVAGTLLLAVCETGLLSHSGFVLAAESSLQKSCLTAGRHDDLSRKAGNNLTLLSMLAGFIYQSGF